MIETKDILTFLCFGAIFTFLISCADKEIKVIESKKIDKEIYQAPDTSQLNNDEWGITVKYGLQLIKNTAYYIGQE